MCAPKIEPRIATPTVAPTIRPTLTSPDDVPERSLGTLDTATVMIGPVISPRPAPMANNPANMVASLDWEEIPASAKIPVPVNDMPVAIRMPGPVRINSRPASGDRRKKVSDRGSNSIPATSAE